MMQRYRCLENSSCVRSAVCPEVSSRASTSLPGGEAE
jgi:hypothetical protein